MAGEPKALVQAWSVIASTSLAGSAWPGLEGSMSGMTTVQPMAMVNRPNMGKQARSTSPASMPYICWMASVWALKMPWV